MIVSDFGWLPVLLTQGVVTPASDLPRKVCPRVEPHILAASRGSFCEAPGAQMAHLPPQGHLLRQARSWKKLEASPGALQKLQAAGASRDRQLQELTVRAQKAEASSGPGLGDSHRLALNCLHCADCSAAA